MNESNQYYDANASSGNLSCSKRTSLCKCCLNHAKRRCHPDSFSVLAIEACTTVFSLFLCLFLQQLPKLHSLLFWNSCAGEPTKSTPRALHEQKQIPLVEDNRIHSFQLLYCRSWPEGHPARMPPTAYKQASYCIEKRWKGYIVKPHRAYSKAPSVLTSRQRFGPSSLSHLHLAP